MPRTILEPFPKDYLVDATKSHEAVFVDPSDSIYADSSIAESFRLFNEEYAADKAATFRLMWDSIHHFRVPGTLGLSGKVNMLYASNESDAESEEITLSTTPINDGLPWTSMDRLLRYAELEKPSFRQIALARPNSINPLVKFYTAYRIGNLSGRVMPHAQLLSPLTPHAFTVEERIKMAHGDYSGWGRVALEGLQYINSIRLMEGKKPIRRANIFGAALGERAFALARYMKASEDEHGIEVQSAHALNLALNRGIGGTAVDHVLQREVKEASQVPIPEGHERIDETLLRQDTDKKGTDTLQLWIRQFWGIKDLATTTLPHSRMWKPTVEDVRYLQDNGVITRVTNALNAGMAINTLRVLPITHRNFRYSTVVGIQGQKTDMMVGENSVLIGITTNQGAKDYEDKLAA